MRPNRQTARVVRTTPRKAGGTGAIFDRFTSSRKNGDIALFGFVQAGKRGVCPFYDCSVCARHLPNKRLDSN